MNTKLRENLPLFVTAGIFILLFAIASIRYAPNFCSLPNIANLFVNNAAIGIISVGMTLVIFSGGIDLSVGAVAGFTNIFVATLITTHGWNPLAAMFVTMVLGILFGAAQGVVIQVFKQPAFLVTLAGMFFARGCAYWVSTASVTINDPLYTSLTGVTLKLGRDNVHPLPAIIFLAVFAAAYVVSHHMRFGRNLLAIGGSEQSAMLMGLPVGATKIAAYAICGGCAALSGLVNTLFTSSGNSVYGIGYELDAIAIVVIGGTLLTGGRGHMFGTLCGFLIIGTIKLAIAFDGSLSSSWISIITGGLLLGFILFQRLLLRATQKKLT